MTILAELKELKETGVNEVMLNGWSEDIDYVIKLSNLKKIDIGWYETK